MNMKDMDAISEMGSGRNGLMGYFDGGLGMLKSHVHELHARGMDKE